MNFDKRKKRSFLHIKKCAPVKQGTLLSTCSKLCQGLPHDALHDALSLQV